MSELSLTLGKVGDNVGNSHSLLRRLRRFVREPRDTDWLQHSRLPDTLGRADGTSLFLVLRHVLPARIPSLACQKGPL